MPLQLASSSSFVLVSAAGAALLRVSRPSRVALSLRAAEGRSSRKQKSSATTQWLLWNLLGVFGALLLFVGLTFGSIPFLMGVSNNDEGKAAAIVQSTLVLMCWLVERILLTGRPLPRVQSYTCVVVWFGSTLVEWAGPRPYDDMSLGLAGQTAGCDGGFRSPFLMYASTWLTGIVFGTLLLFCSECGPSLGCVDDDGDDEVNDRTDAKEAVPKAFRCKALPVIYALATSMSGVLFATGTASNQMGYIVAGALLLLLAVLSAWDWLWRLEMNLSTWGALFQGFTVFLRAVQRHAVFRDLRWDPTDVHGFLVVYQFPGLQIFIFGMFVMFAVLQFYVYTSHWADWKGGDGNSTKSADELALKGRSRTEREESFDDLDPSKLGRGSRSWQWVFLLVCITCQVIGIHVPLIQTECTLPALTWAHDTPAAAGFHAPASGHGGYTFSQGESYIDVIDWLYKRRLPCSALVASWNAMVLPPLQFILIFMILLRPAFLPEDLLHSLQAYVMNLAPMRFTQPCIMMMIVGVANIPIPSQHFSTLTFGGSFTSGYWLFMTYCVTNIILAWSVQPTDKDKYADQESEGLALEKRYSAKENPVMSKYDWSTGQRVMEKGLIGESRVDSRRNRGDGASDSDDSGESDQRSLKSLELMGITVAVVLMVICVFLALTQPYLHFEFRVSGVTVHKVTPTILDVWFSIGSVSIFLMALAAATLIVLPLTWIALFAIRMTLEPEDREAGHWSMRLEPILRPWVMCHIWAASFVLVYYIVASRNKAVIEVCAKVPSIPVGLIAIVLMGAVSYALVGFAKSVTRPSHIPEQSKIPPLPGGALLWVLGPSAMMIFWLVLLSMNGPTFPQTISNVKDMNVAFSKALPNANQRFHKDITPSFGDCKALWDDRTSKGQVLHAHTNGAEFMTCSGSSALAHQTTVMGTAPHAATVDVIALWANGVNTLELVDVVVDPPGDASSPLQQWYLNVRGLFYDLHLYMKVMVDGKEWYSDYVCCDKPYHFTIQVAGQCRPGIGFGSMSLHLVHLDKLDSAERSKIQQGPAWAALMNDNGRRDMVLSVVENFLTAKTGKLLLRNFNNKTTDALHTVAEIISDVLKLNTGHVCATDI